LLSFASSDKTINCAIIDDKTCSVENQAIDSVGFKIASIDSKVEKFHISNNPKAEFLPENLSEMFPNLIDVQIWNSFKGLHKLIDLNLGVNKIETMLSRTM
jgi:hypothetical protein